MVSKKLNLNSLKNTQNKHLKFRNLGFAAILTVLIGFWQKYRQFQK